MGSCSLLFSFHVVLIANMQVVNNQPPRSIFLSISLHFALHKRGDIFLGMCMIFNRISTYLNVILFFHQGTIGKLFACRFQITIDIEGIVKMNLIFCYSKKSAKIAENAQIPNVGSISTHRKYFFWQKKFPLSFYTSKTIEKTLGHLILRTFAIFNPTYYLMCSTTTSSRTFYLMCSMNTSSSTSSFPSLMSSMSCKSKKPKKLPKKKKKKKKKYSAL